MKKQVQFSDVTIISFPMVLGDNPAVSEGAPVQLGWTPCDTATHQIELYEYLRSSESGKRRRRGRRLVIPTDRRGRILLQGGFSLTEIACAVMQVEDDKKMRRDSLSKPEGWDRLSLLLKNTGKIPKDILQGVFEAGKKMTQPVQKSLRARSA